MKKKILVIILIIGMLLIGIKSYAGLKEVEQVLEGVELWTEEKLFIDSTLITNKNKVDKLKKLKDLSLKRINEYDKKLRETINTGDKKTYNIIKNVYEYLYYRIDEVLKNPNGFGGIIAGNISVPKINNGKIPFSSSFVKVDTLGNVQINKNGKWEYFFPVCLYHDEHRPSSDRKKYSMGGRFNCIMARDSGFVKKAKKAGLMSVLQLVQYADGGELGGKLDEELTRIRKMGLQKDLLFLHVDNERDNSADWVINLFRKYKRIADQYDKDPKTGKRMHPLYYLNGRTGDALKQDRMGMVSDITGSYVYERYEGEAENGPTKIVTLEHNGTKQPVVFAELNFGVGGHGENANREPIRRKMTPIAMSAVAVGARGVAYWRDGGSTGAPIEKHGFRNDLAVFTRDIKKLMSIGIIQQPDNVFSLKCGQSESAQIGAGTRKLNGIGYAILTNRNNGAKTVNCRIGNLGYTPKSLTDVLKGRNVGRVNGNSFSVQVPAYHRVIVKLNK